MSLLPSGPTRIRFVGGHDDVPDLFDFECRLVSRVPDTHVRGVALGGIVLETLTNPPRAVRLRSRYIGKVIGAVDSAATTTTCTYELDPNDRGMAIWSETDDGAITVRAFDYPG